MHNHHGHSHGGPVQHGNKNSKKSPPSCWINLATAGECANVITSLLYGISWGKFINSGIQLARGEEYDGTTTVATALPTIIFYVTCALGALVSHRNRDIFFANRMAQKKTETDEACPHSTSTLITQKTISTLVTKLPSVRNEGHQGDSAIHIVSNMAHEDSTSNQAAARQTLTKPVVAGSSTENETSHAESPKHKRANQKRRKKLVNHPTQENEHKKNEPYSRSPSTNKISSMLTGNSPRVQNESRQIDSVIQIASDMEYGEPATTQTAGNQTQKTPLIVQPHRDYKATDAENIDTEDNDADSPRKGCCARIMARLSDAKKNYYTLQEKVSKLPLKQKAIIFSDFTCHSADIAGIMMTGLDEGVKLLGGQMSFAVRATTQITVSVFSMFGSFTDVWNCADVLEALLEAEKQENSKASCSAKH